MPRSIWRLSLLAAICCFPESAGAQEEAASPLPLRIGAGAALAAILALSFYGFAKGLLRDRKPYDALAGTPISKIPYSLSRVQMAAWTLLVAVSYCFLLIVNGPGAVDIPASVLALIGIVSGTSLAAAVVDHATPDGDALTQAYKEAQATRASLDAQPDDAQAKDAFEAAAARLRGLVPISENPLLDILSDQNGINLHRMQMLCWTFVAMAIFMSGVITDHALPDVDEKLLGLMGISGGVYLGFKIPEKQSA